MKLHLDFETRSTADLRKVGAHKYAEDPTTDVWCAAWAIDDGPVELWAPYANADNPLLYALANADQIVAHNAGFERAICRSVMTPRYGWPEIPLEKWRCTMAMAYTMGLPGSLENASAALGLADSKDAEGHRLMLAMCKPRRARKGEDPGQIYWRDDEASKQRLYQYCKNDVVVERELEKRLLPLSKAEQEIWFLDQRINDRGVRIDRDLCKSALKIVEDAILPLNKELRKVTGGEVSGVNNSVQLAAWLRSRGVEAASVAKDEVEKLLARDDLPPECQRALEIRQEGSLASVAKFDAFLHCAQDDGRARGLLQYHATGTGRWAGRRVQPHNFKRPGHDEESINGIIEEIYHGDYRRIAMLYGPVLPAVSDCLRGAICAAEGHEIIAPDLSNIESRVLAWLAGEQWKLEAFRQYDKGEGADIYKVAYGGAFGIDPAKVTKPQRQIGKPIELAHGYEGGPGSFRVMAKTYGVDISAAYAELTTRFHEDTVAACDAWDWRGRKSGMRHDTWVAAEIVKIRWRAKNPKIVQFWKDIKQAACMAVENPGAIITCGKVKFRMAGSFLFMLLPSRRAICLPYPQVKSVKTPWGSDDKELTFMTTNQYTRKWQRTGLYGGKLANYATQGTSRDILAGGMLRAEAAGYPVVLTVHDEEVTEPPIGHGSAKELETIMATPPAWALDLPLAAEGFQAERYRK
jgi:DNA polymerase